MLLTPGNGAVFERRWNDSSYTGSTHTDATAPEWVRLVRRGKPPAKTAMKLMQ